jgi:hypothetical protein
MIRTFAMEGLLCLAASVGAAHSVVDSRQGICVGSASELRIVLHIGPGSDCAVAGWPDSEGGGAMGIPVTSIVFETTKLTLFVDPISGTYAGRLYAAGTEIKGTWSKGGCRWNSDSRGCRGHRSVANSYPSGYYTLSQKWTNNDGPIPIRF